MLRGLHHLLALAHEPRQERVNIQTLSPLPAVVAPPTICQGHEEVLLLLVSLLNAATAAAVQRR